MKKKKSIKKLNSGLKKENPGTKPKFDLIPYNILARIAKQFMFGAKKYGQNNWKKATKKESETFKESAIRHTLQWADGQKDEDHAIAAITNIIMYLWHESR